MPLYMTQFAYTPQAWAALTKKPENREEIFRGLVQKEGVFLRTPKTKGEPNLVDALKANRAETAFAVLLFAGAVGALVRGHGTGIVADTLAALLLFNAVALMGAPYNSRAAMLADLSPDE